MLPTPWHTEGPLTVPGPQLCAPLHTMLQTPRETLQMSLCCGQTQAQGRNAPVQTSPASSLWSQLLRPQGLRGQSLRACSPPPHPTSSIHTGPEPGPNRAPPGAASAPPQPSSRQATAASRRSHPSSHTVPQRPPCHTSSRPAQPWGPEARRSRSVGMDRNLV